MRRQSATPAVPHRGPTLRETVVPMATFLDCPYAQLEPAIAAGDAPLCASLLLEHARVPVNDRLHEILDAIRRMDLLSAHRGMLIVARSHDGAAASNVCDSTRAATIEPNLEINSCG